MSVEIWRPIEGRSGYEVSNLGLVRFRGKVRALTPDAHGYLRVSFWENGKAVKVGVHILVAAAFIGARPPGLVVRHSDGVNSNNRADNLLYGTQQENEADKALHGTAVVGERHHSNKLTEADVRAIRQRHVPRDPRNSLHAIGRDYGIAAKTVQRIVQRKIWKHVA
jgi:hypothetical protein